MTTENTNAESPPRAHEPEAGPTSIRTYILANVIFWAYLILMLLIAKIVVGDMSGLLFVLGVMGAVFTLVSIADFASDRILEKQTDS